MDDIKLALLIVLVFFIGFGSGLFTCKMMTSNEHLNSNVKANQNINAKTTVDVICDTKDNGQIEIEATLGYDNPENRAEYYVEDAITEGSKYVFSFYDVEETKTNTSEIKALTLEQIFNILQDKGFVVYEYDYKIKE